MIPARSVKLSADIIEAFAGTFLSPRYDNPVATPEFHRQGWEAYASDDPQVGLAAPRDHAKSTAFTFVYALAESLFRVSDYTIIIGSTEENAAEQLSNIREELLENDDLRAEFGIVELEKDSTTDIIVRCDDGHRFRILARGAEQRIRGRLWKGKRPNLIICDDMEDDEQVENKERRAKFRRWFFRAAKQALARGGRIRAHGTILHDDSLLARLRKNKTWKFLFFRAHRAFDDFAEILWTAAWDEARLRKRRQEFVEDGDSGGYSQEFLNDPQDSADAYLRKQDFLPMSSEDRLRPKIVGAAIDFAVSKADLANRTSITVGGKCSLNILHVIDERVDRWASLEVLPDGTRIGWIEEMFSVQKRWNPEFFWVEAGVIWEAVKHMVYSEMRGKDIWINIVEVPSVKDKATRGRTLQKRMRAGGVRFDKEADWYPGYEAELLRFTGASQATLDDQFDSTSLLAIGFERHMDSIEPEDFMEEEELSMREQSLRLRGQNSRFGGRSLVTGY
jgi:hypothetical protein